MSRFLRAALRRAPSWDAALALAAPVGCAALLVEAHQRTELGDAEAPAACRCAGPAPFGAAAVRSLERDGVAVVDGFLTAAELRAARRDVARLGTDTFARAGDHGERGDTVSWVRGGERGGGGAGLARAIARLRGVAAAVEGHGYSGSTAHRVPRQCQLALHGAGSKGYDRHLDRCAETLAELGLLEWLRLSDYRERALTAIVYLNDADWRLDADGGALRCWDARNGGRFLFDVAPRGGRLVLFDAGAIEHAARARAVAPCAPLGVETPPRRSSPPGPTAPRSPAGSPGTAARGPVRRRAAG